MTEAGMLSIMRREQTYQVCYASSKPYDMDRPPYLCPDEGSIIPLLHHYEIDPWALQQAIAVLRKGGEEPPERLAQLITMAEATCFTMAALRNPVPVALEATVNGQPFSPATTGSA